MYLLEAEELEHGSWEFQVEGVSLIANNRAGVRPTELT